MSFNFAASLSAVIFLFVTGCSNGEAPKSSGKDRDDHLRLIFRWSGDEFASKQDLETRDKIGQRILEKNVGKIIRSGTGMGWMDIVVEVSDEDGARKEIEKIVRELFPDSNFIIEPQ